MTSGTMYVVCQFSNQSECWIARYGVQKYWTILLEMIIHTCGFLAPTGTQEVTMFICPPSPSLSIFWIHDFRMASWWCHDDVMMTSWWLYDDFWMTLGWLQEDDFRMTCTHYSEHSESNQTLSYFHSLKYFVLFLGCS